MDMITKQLTIGLWLMVTLAFVWFVWGVWGAQQVINTTPGSSDLPVTAFNKVNSNFTELYGGYLPRTNGTATNLVVDGLTIKNLSATNFVLTVTASGIVTNATAITVDASTTAGQTRFFLYDVDNGTVERVTVGSADSGGTGFKLLRIPN